jgi:hypothetical protein
MPTFEELVRQREPLVKELAELIEIRRGSVVEQFVEVAREDGSKGRRGPYLLYSYKEKGKTVSQRLTDPQEAATYRRQIAGFRRFQELTAQLVELGECISDCVAAEEGGKKTSSSRSQSKRTRRFVVS